MLIKQVLAENFDNDYGKNYNIHDSEAFIAKIKDWVKEDFEDAFYLATTGTEVKYAHLHDQVCEILKPYALKYVLEIAKNQHVPTHWETEEYFDHWIDQINKYLQPDWPELDHIVAVAAKAFAHGRPTESVKEGTEESDEFVAEFLGYLDQKNYWEAFNSLISAYDSYRDCLQVWHWDIEALKPEIIKGLLHVIKNDPDLPVDSIISDLYEDFPWPELKTIKSALMLNKPTKSVTESATTATNHIQLSLQQAENGNNTEAVLELADAIRDLNHLSSYETEHYQLLDQIKNYKAEYVRGLLELIKFDLETYEYDISLVTKYIKSYFRWPEADMIQKALIHGKQLESVAEDYYHDDDDTQTIISNMGKWFSTHREEDDEEGYEYLNQYVAAIQDGHANIIKARDLAPYKAQIIKCMLKKIKEDKYEWEVGSVETIIEVLQDAGIRWPELDTINKALEYKRQNESVAEAYDPEEDPVIGYVQTMYSDLVNGETDLTVLNLRDYTYDTGSPENLARSILEIEPRLPALIEKNKHDIIKSMLEMVKKDYEYAGKVLFPVFKVLDHLGIHWPECARIATALSQGTKKPNVNGSQVAESDNELSMGREQLKRMAANHIMSAIQNQRWMSLLDTTQTIEQEQWSLDSQYRLADRLAPHKKDIIKNILQAIKDPRWFNPDVITSIKGLKRLGINWPELDTIISGLQHGKKQIGESVTGADMLKIFNQTHHQAGENPEMEQYIQDHDWGIKMITPAQLPDIDDEVYFDDPFNRVMDIDTDHVRDVMRNMSRGGKIDPIILGPNGSIIDGNHRAQAAKKMGVNIQAYVPMNKISEDLTASPELANAQHIARQMSSRLEKVNKALQASTDNTNLVKSDFMDSLYWLTHIPSKQSDLALPILNHYKKTVVYMLLYIVKHHLDYHNFVELIALQKLAGVGINWPELSMIAKALHHDNKQVAEDLTVTDAPRVPAYIQSMEKKLSDNLRNLFQFVIDLAYEDRMSDPKFCSQVLAVFEKMKPELVKYMLHKIKHSDSDNVKWLAPAMIRMGLDWPELYTMHQALSVKKPAKAVSESDDHKDYKILSDMMARDFAEHPVRGFYMMLYHLNELELTVADMPELKPLIDKVKPDVIRALLQSVKADNDGMNISNALQILDRMQKCGVDWPEIDKIRQGLQHGRQHTTEGIDEIESDRLKSFVKQIQQPLASKTGWLAAVALEDLASVSISKMYGDKRFTDADYAEAAAVLNLNSHKDVLVKGILENIKQNIANGNSTTWLAENVAMQKKILKKLGCNWPEMDRIAAAVAHNAN